MTEAHDRAAQPPPTDDGASRSPDAKGDHSAGTAGCPQTSTAAKSSATSQPPTGEGDHDLPAVKEKIGEAPDNLRRREAWFQRRAGRRP
jgi:hypothetical protein